MGGGISGGEGFSRLSEARGPAKMPLPDFYIGAHAAMARFRLLTRDARRYSQHFPTVELIAP